MKRVILSSLLTGLIGCSGAPTPTPVTEPASSSLEPVSAGPQQHSREACNAQAEAQLQTWKDQGLSDSALEQRLQEAIARCAGDNVDAQVAWLVGRVNWDYTQLARQLIAGKVDGSTYVGRVRDRTRKRKLAMQDASRLEALRLGDEDEDLVPDGRTSVPERSRLSPRRTLAVPWTRPERWAAPRRISAEPSSGWAWSSGRAARARRRRRFRCRCGLGAPRMAGRWWP